MPFLIDTFATYSVVSLGTSHFLLDDRSIQVVGILGQLSTCSFPSIIQVEPLTRNVFSFSPDSPVGERHAV